MEVDEAPAGFPHAEVGRHREELGRADEEQDSAKAKATLAVFVEEIAVHSRGEVQPTYRLPLEDQPVRAMHRKVGRTEYYANRVDVELTIEGMALIV